MGVLPALGLAALAPPAYAAQGDLSFVDAASSGGNRTNHTVSVPAGVQAGDALVMFLTTNSTNSTIDDAVPGWTLLDSQDGNRIRGRAWTRTAAAGDAGSTVSVTTSGWTKSTLVLAAYRSTSGNPTVSASAGETIRGSATDHTTPQAEVTEDNSWLLSYWSEKSSGAVTWTLPGEATERAADAAPGNGKVSAVLGDSNGPVPTASSTARTAVTDPAVGRSMMFSVVVDPGDDGAPGPGPDPNQAPTAAFTADCTDLDCDFDASGSTDPDGDPLTYDWDFGDGNTLNDGGATPTHTYADGGTRTVSLTVSDGDLDDTTTGDADPTDPVAPPPPPTGDGEVTHVDTASSAGNRTNHSVQVPTGVQAGDLLMLFLTTNSTNSTIDDALPGWTLEGSQDGIAMRGRVWSRVATAGDVGSTVAVSTSGWTKSVMLLSAYRGDAGTPTVDTVAGDQARGSTTSHTTPAVEVAGATSWLLSYWSEKSGGTETWTLPGAATLRVEDAAGGGGKVSGVLGDSDAPVPAGTAGGLTATTADATGRTTTFSVVITAPGGAPEPNQAPTAAFTADCTDLDCDFDASGSTDPDGDPLTYDWDFGDGTTLNDGGATPTHTYADGGTRTVSLTVSDGDLDDTTTGDADPTDPVPPPPPGAQPVPNHAGLVPEIPRTDVPVISDGEIWDIELIGNRVFIAGSFGGLQNRAGGNTDTVNQPLLAAYNINTGLIDTDFRPVFTGGGVTAVEASPDGSRLYIAGSFNTVNGENRRNVARINPNTGAPLLAFSANTNSRAGALAVTNTDVYVGGQFDTIKGQPRGALAKLDGVSGDVDPGFVNNLSGGIGPNGALTVQELKLTHDGTKLLVVHTGRRVNGLDRYGVALIRTSDDQLLPWRSTIWEDYLPFVGGTQRIYAGDISPDDSYFVVGSGSGGDRPPINDTAIAFPIDGGSDVQPLWISRHFDSIYSVAITEVAVYVGGHFYWAESPESPQPWPGLDDQGYGTGQGLSGYGLGDHVVHRDQVAALDPANGIALEWNPGANAYEGQKAMLATERGLFVGGDAITQGGYNGGRVAFYDFASVPPSNGTETAIVTPIEGRVKPTNEEFQLSGTAESPGGVARVQVEILDRDTRQYLQDDLTTWGSWNGIDADLTSTGPDTADWSVPLTFTRNLNMQALARAVGTNGSSDPSKATKKFETFGLDDQPPNTWVRGPSSPVNTMTFVVNGDALDDHGVNRITMTIRDDRNYYLQDDGTAAPSYNAFSFEPDVVGAPNPTWSYEVTVPYEGTWRAQARATDTNGQIDLDTGDRTWIVAENGERPTVSISSPTTMIPPTPAQTLVVEPGSPMTFSGSANDDEGLNYVEIALWNTTTREYLASDGTWGPNSVLRWHRISGPNDLPGTSYNWSFTTPFDLSPGNYNFYVRARDDLGLRTSNENRGRLVINAQVAGDEPPNGLLDVTGTVTGGQDLRLDLTGTATDDNGVDAVNVSVYDGDSNRYLHPDGSMSANYARLPATLNGADPTNVTFALGVDLPVQGDWNVTAFALDTVGQTDLSTSGATARYRIYPGDTPPTITEGLLSPTEGTTFDDGRIFTSGRAEDDQSMKQVEVAVVNEAGLYMRSNGSFLSPTESWNRAFLTSPGTPGSNFSYTTPIVPEGDYTVYVRAMDQHDQLTEVPSERHVSVTHPPGNAAPGAAFSVDCTENLCSFDGRGSTDEAPARLSYSWDFGNGGGSGAVPTRTYTAEGTYTVTLTVIDEWGLVDSASQDVTISTPAGNAAPTAVINPPSCAGLSCNISAVGSADPNEGDSLSYTWDFGDGTTPGPGGSALSHTFPAADSYTVSLTVTDGWGLSDTVTREITVTAP